MRILRRRQPLDLSQVRRPPNAQYTDSTDRYHIEFLRATLHDGLSSEPLNLRFLNLEHIWLLSATPVVNIDCDIVVGELLSCISRVLDIARPVRLLATRQRQRRYKA